MADDELTPDPAPRPRGFSTRAILAASRVPRVDQRPSSVPIYQTATFSSADAQELGDVFADGSRTGYAYSRIGNPTTAALAAAYAELAGGEAGIALASGMGAIHAALASQLKAGDRVVAPLAIYGSTRTQLIDTFAQLRGHRRLRRPDRHRGGGRGRSPPPRPASSTPRPSPTRRRS